MHAHMDMRYACTMHALCMHCACTAYLDERDPLEVLRAGGMHALCMHCACTAYLDERDPLEVLRVGDAQALHAIGMPPLLEMTLEWTRAPVGVVAADLALELEVEPV